MRRLLFALGIIAIGTTSSARDESIWGAKWIGIAEQAGHTYSVRISGDPQQFSKGTFGTIDYPGLGCGGSLKLANFSSDGRRATMTEQIEYGSDRCDNNGAITLEHDSSNDRVTFKWIGKAGSDSVTGVLERSSTIADRFLDQAARYLDPANDLQSFLDYAAAMGKAGRGDEVRSRIPTGNPKSFDEWNPERKADHFHLLSKIWLAIGDTPTAIARLERSKDFALEIEKPVDRATKLALLMNTAASARAEKLFSDLESRVMNIARDFTPEESAFPILYRAAAWYSKGDSRRSRALLDNAVAAASSSNDPSRTQTLAWLGEEFSTQGHSARAGEVLDMTFAELEEIYPENSADIRKAFDQAILSLSYMNHADIPRALAFARKGPDGKPSELALKVVALRMAKANQLEEAARVADEALQTIRDDGLYRLEYRAELAGVLGMTRNGGRGFEMLGQIARELREDKSIDDLKRGVINEKIALSLARLSYPKLAQKYAELQPYSSGRARTLIAISEIIR